MVIAIKSEMSTVGLCRDVFDRDNPTLGVQRAINEMLYDTLTYVIEPYVDSVAYGYLMGTDSATDRDGRRALVDLIKGCVPPAIRQKHQAEHSVLRLQDRAHVSLAELSDLVSSIYMSWQQYAGGAPGTAAAVGVPGDENPDRDDILGRPLARLDKIETFIKTRRLGVPLVGGLPMGGKKHPADSTAAYCQPVDECSTKELHTLALCKVFQAASDGGATAFAAAIELHGAPAVVGAGAASGGVDISAYGFTTGASGASGDDDMDVHEELRDLRQQIGTAISMQQVSIPPAQGISFAGVSTEPQSAIVPSAGGDHPSFMGSMHHPTEEFPGGVELIPARQRVPTVTIDPPVSAVACSFSRGAASFVEPERESRFPIDDLFSQADAEEEGFPPPIDGGPRVAASCGVSAVRPQQVVGCGVPPFGMRPTFLMLACLLGLLCFGIAGAAAGLGDMSTSIDGISITEDPVMCKGALCIYSGLDKLSPEARQQVLQLFAAGGVGMAAAASGGDLASEHGGVTTWDVP
ncbi:hypothetical protein CYMTET_4771 [Cymbomonas tetramitiformis]|uniref:Uncharacterized protein n=1 Tax=Cymbomonas tetramitiformis TaxID=36881 RepID=A0AAE0LJT2_9CHLO|nr:hypothetical protein CYMTET_4771 [Cymbomonas tetramitiformis]